MTVAELIKQLETINPEARVDILVPYELENDKSMDYETSRFEVHSSHSGVEEQTPYIELYCLLPIGLRYDA